MSVIVKALTTLTIMYSTVCAVISNFPVGMSNSTSNPGVTPQ